MKKTLLVTLCSILLIPACGQDHAQTEDYRDPTLADLVFAPVNVGSERLREENKSLNALFDAGEIVLASAVAAVNIVQVMRQSSTHSLLPESLRASGQAVSLNAHTVEGIMAKFTEVQQGLYDHQSAGTRVVLESEVKIMYFDVANQQGINMSEVATKIDSEISKIESKLTTTLQASSEELKILRQAQTNIANLQTAHESTLMIKSATDAERMKGHLQALKQRNMLVKNVTYKIVDRPVLSAGRKAVSRMLYIYVAGDIANDLYQGFDHREIGMIGN